MTRYYEGEDSKIYICVQYLLVSLYIIYLSLIV